MKELIIKALDEAIVVLEKRVPQTKNKTLYFDISEISPKDIPDFMKVNNIPDNAYFGGKDNGYDGWDCTPYLCQDINVPTSEIEKLKYRRAKFGDVAWRFVYDVMKLKGYKVVGFSSGLLKEFQDTTVYDMYRNKQFDRLEKYYSMRFVLNS